jgi:hypothetical protein
VNAVGHVVVEPAHVPFAQVVAAHDPPGAIAPVEHGKIALELAFRRQHGRKPARPGPGSSRGHQPVEPAFRVRPRHLEAREACDVQKADAFAHRLAFLGHHRMCVGALERRLLDEVLRREIERQLQPPARAPAAAGGGHVGVGRRHLQWPPGRQLLVRIGHHEAAGIELAGGLLDELLVLGIRAVAGNIHAEHVRFRFAVDDPFRQRLAHAAALQEARHHRAGAPVAGLAAHRPDQRVAVRREGEGTVDPVAHADLLQTGKRSKPSRSSFSMRSMSSCRSSMP